MTKLVAVDYAAGKALFDVNDLGVVVDINEVDVVSTSGMKTALTAGAWIKVANDFEYPGVWRELADAAGTDLEIHERKSPSADRKFRVPASVKAEAQQALDWVTGFERGQSTLGIAVAKMLTTENLILGSKLDRIAKYFSRRPASITENAGWSPGEQGYPCNDRIKYGLWGGSAARAWVNKILEKHELDATDEAEPVDPTKPHKFVDNPELPGYCIYCGREPADMIHRGGMAASAFDYDGACDYFGRGLDPDTTYVDALYMHRPDGTWALRADNDWQDCDEPTADVLLIMLDEDSAYKLADVIDDGAVDNPSVLPYELAMVNPHEAALVAAAESEIDWELVDRVFDIYDSEERSINAKKQIRGVHGRFAPGGKPSPGPTDAGKSLMPKARLRSPLEVIPDVGARIDEYLQEVAQQRGQASTQEFDDVGGVTDVRPLYLAIVDSIDTSAVLDLVALVPGADGKDVSAWKRDAGKWVSAADILGKLRSATPPPVVELKDDNVLREVIKQVDVATSDGEVEPEPEKQKPAPGETPTNDDGSAGPKPDANPDQQRRAASAVELADVSDKERENLAKKGYALPDGSYPIRNVSDLKNAIQAFGRAKNLGETKKHIIKRAKALNRRDLIPDSWDKEQSTSEYTLWGPHGEIVSLVAEGGLDKNRGNAERLRRYWEHGEGAAKIVWGTPGDWYRCVSHLSKYLGARSKGYCTLRHKSVTGYWPGQEPGPGGK